MTTQGQTLLQVDYLHTDITVRDGVVHALDGVSFTVNRGETLGVVGESGCGKTMTALSIMGLLPQGGRVSDGHIVLNGTDLVGEKPPDVRRLRGTEIGMIFQDPLTSLNPTMKIGKQVSEPLLVHTKISKKEAHKQAIETLRRVGMPRPESVADSYPHQLSGGMRQRAMIAMALVCRPKLLIADEPTTALDVTTQKQILDLIDEMRDEFNMGVILITHDLGVVAGHTDRVAVMYGGMIVEEAPTDELFARPTHRYTSSLLAALPERALESNSTLVSIPGAPPSLRALPQGCRFAPRCRWASDDCRNELPPFEALPAIPEHKVACFHPVQEDESTLIATSNKPKAVEVQTPEDTSLLSIDSVSREYPGGKKSLFGRSQGVVSAVDRVSLWLGKGSTYGLVGESGCGKSTLGRLVAALEPPSSGKIIIGGTDTQGGSRRSKLIHREVQMMFQDSYAAMDPRMRIDEILAEPIRIQKTMGKKATTAHVNEILDSVGLPYDSLNRYPHEFSGGQLQRVGLARSLMLNPDLIVADEPVSALDVSVQAQVLNLMKNLQAERGLSYLFISHDLAVVQYMADRIGVMYLGRLVEEGPSDQVVLNPLHPYTQVLIDSIPVPDPLREREVKAIEISGEPPSALNPPSGCRFRTRCPFAQDVCKTEPPLEGGKHKVACHFPLGEVLSKPQVSTGTEGSTKE